MEQDTTQPEISSEESFASLGLATRLSEQMLMNQAQQNGTLPVEAPQDAQNAPGQEKGQEMGDSDDKDIEAQDEADKGEDKTDEKLEILRTELKDTIKMEIDGIKQMIKEALSEENGEN